MTFNGDGTKAYFTGFGPDAILQYSLSTAWDISTASYDNVSLDVSGQTTAGQSGLVFSPDGSKIYMASYTPDAVYQYNLSTPFDMSSGSYSNNSLTVNEDTNVQDVYLKPDGTKLFVLGDTNNSVFQYTMSTPFDLSTASYDSVSFSTATQQTNCTGLFFSPDGTTMLICGYFPIQADKYTLSTPWDITTATHDTSFDLTNEFGSNSPNAIFAGNDLSNLFVSGSSGSGNGAVYQYAVGMPTGSPFVYGGLTNGTSYTFNVWAINAFGWSVASDPSGSVSPLNPTRAVYAGGGFNTGNVIGYFQINSGGENASDFGDLNTSDAFYNLSCSSSTRGIFGGGGNGGSTLNEYMEYVTIATTGNATNFGQFSNISNPAGTGRGAYFSAACSSSTRGVIARGKVNANANEVNNITYITIASTGTDTDFGDFSEGANYAAACSSPTRGVFIVDGNGGFTNTLQYITIASTGNSTNFGNTVATTSGGPAGASSSTRGLFCTGGNTNIDYITIASTGNATDFGDLTTQSQGMAFASDSVTAVRCGGYDGSGYRNTMDSVTIATTGNATDFGDLTQATYGFAACSDSHGGLS